MLSYLLFLLITGDSVVGYICFAASPKIRTVVLVVFGIAIFWVCHQMGLKPRMIQVDDTCAVDTCKHCSVDKWNDVFTTNETNTNVTTRCIRCGKWFIMHETDVTVRANENLEYIVASPLN